MGHAKKWGMAIFWWKNGLKNFSNTSILVLLVSSFCCQTDFKPQNKKEKPDEIICYFPESPRFPGCEFDSLSSSERRACADKKLFQFVREHLIWPQTDGCVEGMVVISFVVEKDGSLTNFEVVRKLLPLFDEEALRVVRLMPKWIPVIEKGEPVRWQFNLPIKFKLE